MFTLTKRLLIVLPYLDHVQYNRYRYQCHYQNRCQYKKNDNTILVLWENRSFNVRLSIKNIPFILFFVLFFNEKNVKQRNYYWYIKNDNVMRN